MLLVNQRVTRQLQADAAEQLATADAVLKHSQQLRLDNVLALFRKAESEPRFKALATLFDRDRKKFSGARQLLPMCLVTSDEELSAAPDVVLDWGRAVDQSPFDELAESFHEPV